MEKELLIASLKKGVFKADSGEEIAYQYASVVDMSTGEVMRMPYAEEVEAAIKPLKMNRVRLELFAKSGKAAVRIVEVLKNGPANS